MSDDDRPRVGRLLAILAVTAMVLMWIYIFSGVAREDPPDSLSDPAFTAAAEPLCATAVDEVAGLPSAGAVTDAVERAEVLDEANAVFTAMVAELDAITVSDDSDADLIGQWLDDWRTVLDDRQAFADRLRVDEEAELLVTARGGRQITLTLDRFAEINDMPSCATPLDA
jgi:hypothetical protein